MSTVIHICRGCNQSAKYISTLLCEGCYQKQSADREAAAGRAADAVNAIGDAITPSLSGPGDIAFLRRVIELLESSIDGIEGGMECD